MASVSESIVGIFSNLWRGSMRRRVGDKWFYKEIDSRFVWGGVDPLLSFMEVPEVNAIINKRSSMFSNGVPKVLNRNGKPVQKDEFLAKLRNPNWYQSFEEFVKNSRVYRDVYGEELIYLQHPVGFSAEEFKNIFTLPPNEVELKMKASLPFFKYEEMPISDIKSLFKFENKEYSLDYNSLVHINDNNISSKQSNMLRGTSKLHALTPVINNIRMSYESRGVILKYRGAIGVLSNDQQDAAGAVPLDDKEKKHMQDSFRDYGTMQGQSQLIITNARVKWQNMMVNNPMNLGLYKEVEEDFNKLLDSYSMPQELFTREKGTTFENQNQARKSVYENAIIPDAAEWCMALNRKFFYDTPHKLVLDYFHLPIFQQDIKHRTEAVQTAANALTVLLSDQQITPQEYREELAKLGIGNGNSIPPPAETDEQAIQTSKAQAELRGSVGGVTAMVGLLQAVSRREISADSARNILTTIYGITPQEAAAIVEEPQQLNNSNNEQNNIQE